MTGLIVSPTGWRKSSHSGSDGTECVEVATAWRKSSHSGSQGTECVEVARADRMTAVRDSKNPDGPLLCFTRSEWTAFLTHLKHSAESISV